MKIKKYQLKNGLTVVLVQSRKSPVVSIQMWVRTGSADESARQAGLSHFIEHLLFKGTKSFRVGEIAALVEGAGGELNAFTSFDQTVFYVTVANAFEDLGLKVISEMMGCPLFDPVEVDNEREVVIEEIKRGLDSPHRQASQLMFSTAYPQHPYGRPVIGYEKIIRSVSVKAIRSYFNDRYVTKNMFLVVVGDFETSMMETKIESHFSDLKKKNATKVKRTFRAKGRKNAIQMQSGPFKESLLHLAWPIPKAGHRDIPALDVLAMILGQGESSRLNHRLRMERGLVNYVGASSFWALDPGLLTVSLSLKEEQGQQALEELAREILKISRDLVDQEDIDKAVVNISSEQYYAMETVDGMARAYATFEDLFREPKYFERYLTEIRKVTQRQLHTVAKKYLHPKNLKMAYLAPEESTISTSDLERWKHNVLKEFSRPTKATQPKRRIGRVSGGKASNLMHMQKLKNWKVRSVREKVVTSLERIDLPGGGRLVLRPSYETPVLSLRVGFLGGSRIDPVHQSGVTELFSRAWLAGAGSFSEADLHRDIETMAVGISPLGGRNTVGLSLSGLAPFWEPMMQHLTSLLCEPKFEEAAIKREKAAICEQLRMRNDNPAQVGFIEFAKALFPNHVLGRDPLGTDETISLLDRSAILSYYKQILNAKHAVVVISGACDRSEIVDRVSSIFSKLPTFPHEIAKVKPLYPQSPQSIHVHSAKEQSHIVYGFPSVTLYDLDRYALQVMQSILGGQGGRLFVELRDKASLAYSVAPIRMENIEAGYFGAYIGCSPEKGGRAIEMMQAEFRKLMDHKVKEEELERAKRYVIGRHGIEMQKNSALTAAILFDEIYGLPHEETFHFEERIRSVTNDHILRVAEKVISQPPVIVSVGPVNPSLRTDNHGLQSKSKLRGDAYDKSVL